MVALPCKYLSGIIKHSEYVAKNAIESLLIQKNVKLLMKKIANLKNLKKL
jgi:hypothetical protein